MLRTVLNDQEAGFQKSWIRDREQKAPKDLSFA